MEPGTDDRGNGDAGGTGLRDELVQRLSIQVRAYDTITAGLSAAALEWRPAPGTWSARENLAHLARYHSAFLERLRRILREDVPEVGRYRAEEDPEFEQWRELPTSELLERLRAGRAELIEWVRALSEADVRRSGRHPAFGVMPLATWLEFFLAHEGHHLYVFLKRAREGEVRLTSQPDRPRQR